jgi:2-methylcitrate dehydratase PrpD
MKKEVMCERKYGRAAGQDFSFSNRCGRLTPPGEITKTEIPEEIMEYTRKLAEHCAAISFDSLPAEVVHKAKLCVLDYIANVYGSLELDAVKGIISYFRSLGTSGDTTVLGCGFKTDLQHAAFINGTTAEAIEAQDGVRFGGNHPGAAVIPAVFAAAEKRKVSGRAVIEAIVAGYEAATRPAAAMHPWHTLSGFLPTGTCGTFGAAAAASRLRGYDTERMLNAIGNAGYVLPISMAEHLMGGYTVKIVQAGQAASSGILAAGLAQVGITGAPYVLEGSSLNGGFTQITTGAEPKLEKLVEGFGEHFSIMDVYFKPYTACRHTHGAAQATLAITAEHCVNPENVASIDVYTYGIAELAVGKGVTPGSSFVSAQFSIPYVVAVCIADAELGPRQLTEKRLRDAALIELSRKVNVKTDEKLNGAYPARTSSRVEMTLKNGSCLKQQIDIPKGDPRDPMTAEDVAYKVRRFAGARDKNNIEAVIGFILELDNKDDVAEIFDLI